MTKPLIVIAGGGTGGHVYPALAAARELVEAGAHVEFIGTSRGFEMKLVPSQGFTLHTLPVRGLIGKSTVDRARGALLLPLAVWRAYRLLGRLRPAAVLGVGGYASGPALIAAWLRRIPVAIHEQNAIPGQTNRLGARFADRIAVSFATSGERFGREVVVTGNPVRREFFDAPPVAARDPIRLLVFGGSQGARIINNRMLEALPLLTGTRIGIVHQTGPTDYEPVREAYRRSPFRGAVVVPFLDDMPREASTADLVIARAGATTVAELAAAGRASILIPFAAATGGHQEANARALVEADAAELILERDLTGERLAARVRALAETPGRLAAMGANARRLARPDAARDLAALVLSLARPQR